MVLTGQKPISSFVFNPMPKQTNQVCKGNTEKSRIDFRFISQYNGNRNGCHQKLHLTYDASPYSSMPNSFAGIVCVIWYTCSSGIP